MQPRWPAGCRFHRRAAPFPRPGWLGAACGESVVSAVPNPKWLLRNGNPIKVLLVYLSSSGLFITVQMAATFARHSSVLARARRTEARAPRSLCLHLRGAAGPPAPALPRHPLLQAQSQPGRCLHRAFTPRTFAGRWCHVCSPGVCTGHVQGVFARVFRTIYLPQAFERGISTGCLHHLTAPGICTGCSHRGFAQGLFARGICTLPVAGVLELDNLLRSLPT